MWGIVCLFTCCCLFIHLGLGEAIEKTIGVRFVLFRCVKCLTFWVMAGYSLFFTSFPVEVSICIGFLCAYAALWADLFLGQMANLYEKLSKSMVAERPKGHSATQRDTKDKGHKKQKSQVP